MIKNFLFFFQKKGLISELKMDIKPFYDNIKKQSDLVIPRQKFFELSEKSLTVKENDEILVSCVVERSRPAAKISFFIDNDETSLIKPTTTTRLSSNIIKNDDKTFKTIYMSNIKVKQKDHGKLISCSAENELSSQKLENQRTINVLCMYNINKCFAILSFIKLSNLDHLKTQILFFSQNH
jgi:hypothetical protein